MEEISNGDKPYRNKRISCPHCGGEIGVQVKYDVSVVGLHDGAGAVKDAREAWIATLGDDDRRTLKQVEESDILPSWAGVFIRVHGMAPKVTERAFMAWLKTAKDKIVPRAILDFFVRQYGGRIRFIASQAVGAVVSDGRFKLFIPTDFVVGQSLKAHGSSFRVTDAELPRIDEWIRTKYGYVSGKGLLLEAMRLRCVGDFDKPGVTSN